MQSTCADCVFLTLSSRVLLCLHAVPILTEPVLVLVVEQLHDLVMSQKLPDGLAVPPHPRMQLFPVSRMISVPEWNLTVVLHRKSLVPVGLAVLRWNAASELFAVSQLLRLPSSVRRPIGAPQ